MLMSMETNFIRQVTTVNKEIVKMLQVNICSKLKITELRDIIKMMIKVWEKNIMNYLCMTTENSKAKNSSYTNQD